MTTQTLIDYCLAKKGAYVDYPFGPDVVVIKVEKRIFAQFFVLKGEESVTFNCTAEVGDFYRQVHKGVVVRGYHCPPVQQPFFNTMPVLTSSITDSQFFEMADHSYKTVVNKLPKYVQARLFESK